MNPKQITLLNDEQWPGEGFDFKLPIRPETAAIGVIDVQGYCIDPCGHVASVVCDHNPGLFKDYFCRLKRMTANISSLLDAFRSEGRRVFFTRHGALLPDESDMIERRRSREAHARRDTEQKAGHMPYKGEPGHEILSEVQPQDGELVLDKNTSSAFNSTPIELFLRNMKVDTLILTGVAADMCVLTTALDAADRGFHVIIASDACETLDVGSAEAVQILFGRVFGYVMQTEAIIHWLKTGDEPRQVRPQS